MTSALGFKVRVDPLACVLHHLHTTESSRFTSGATAADLLVASMAVEPFSSMYLGTSIGGLETGIIDYMSFTNHLGDTK